MSDDNNQQENVAKEPSPGPSGSGNLQIAISPAQSDESDYYVSDGEETELKIELIADNLPEDYENELEKNLSADVKPKKQEDYKPKTKRKSQTKIPVHLRGLMGQANIMFAQGNIEIAEKMCYEIIRQVPLAWEPYLTLSQINETTHVAKSMQYLTIAAHLQSRNPFHWLRLAEMHIESNNLKQAVTCYTNAIAANPTNVELHKKRINLLERLEDTRFIQRCKMRLLNTLREHDYTTILSLAKEVAEKYHAEKEYQKAIEAMYVPFNKCPAYITPELVNIMLELLLLTKSYTNCIDIFVQYCNIEIEIVIDDNKKINILSYNMPEDIPIDLRIKFILCIIKLEAFHLIDQLLTPLLNEETVESIGDLYLDVAEALMVADKHMDALKLLIPLVKSKNFSLAAVWLKHAECLKCCNMVEQAIGSYYNVVRMAPQHTDVRHALGELLIQVNKIDEALVVMTQDPQFNEIDASLVIKKIKLLQKIGKYEDVYNSVMFMLSRHCLIIKHYEEIREILQLDRTKDRMMRILTQRKIRGEDAEFVFPHSIKEPSVEEEYAVLKEVFTIAYKRKDYHQLQKMACTALSSMRFKTQMEEIVIISFYACVLSGDLYHAYSLARDIILHKIDHPLAWTCFGFIMHNLEEMRHGRFLLRLARNHGNEQIQTCLVSCALQGNNTKFALMQLVSLIQKKPSPYKFMLMAMTFTQFVHKKVVPLNRKSMMQIIYGFILSYADTRSKDATHEIYYNLGRMYHQYGISHLAAMYYKKVLDYDNEFTTKYPEIVGLKREAAFNLHLIYRDSENYAGARHILYKYLTI